MSLLCEGYFCINTGLSGVNYKYWKDKAECDAWFRRRKKGNLEFKEYSYLRETGLNNDVGILHIPYSLDDLIDVDYVAFKNDLNNRWLYGKISNREFVNEKSTKLYFSVDYVASYLDTFTIGYGFVERRHSFNDSNVVGGTSSQYLLDEPIDVKTYADYRAGEFLSESLDNINSQLYEDLKYSVVSDVAEDGEVGDMQMNYQSGSSIGGYVYIKDGEELPALVNKYVKFSSKLINQGMPLANNIKYIYLAPSWALADTKKVGHLTDGYIDLFTKESLSGYDNINIRHAKTLNYIRYELVGNSGSIFMSDVDYAYVGKILIKTTLTGGVDGKLTLRVCPQGVNFADADHMPKAISEISTFTWPQVYFAGSPQSSKYSLRSLSSFPGFMPVERGNSRKYEFTGFDGHGYNPYWLNGVK